MASAVFPAIGLLVFASSSVLALRKNGNDWPINLGITGAMGDLKPDAPKTIVVNEVLAGTPAAGKLEVGDEITGVNGKRFRIAHQFPLKPVFRYADRLHQ